MKLLYLDMDGVLANFDAMMKWYCPDLHTDTKKYPDVWARSKKVDQICEANPQIFEHLVLIPGAKKAVEKLFNHFEVYFLSTPMWNVPDSFKGKRVWIERHFGEKAHKRLILTHRKDLNIGDFLVDDRTRNGVDQFKGEHIHFGTKKFPDWDVVTPYLMKRK